jgi:hypothetical protein
MASPTTSVFGQNVTLSATVAAVPPGTPVSGMVQFFDGAISLGTSALSSGVALLNVNTLAVGNHPARRFICVPQFFAKF